MQWFLFWGDIFVKSRRKFSVRMKNVLLHYVIQHGRPHNSRFTKEGVGVHQQGCRFDLESGENMKYNIVTSWIFSNLYCLLQFYIIYLKNNHLLNIHILISYVQPVSLNKKKLQHFLWYTYAGKKASTQLYAVLWKIKHTRLRKVTARCC